MSTSSLTKSPQGFGAWRGSYDCEDVAWYESPSGFVEWDAGLSYKCGSSAYMCSLKEWRCRASADEDVCTPNLKHSLGPANVLFCESTQGFGELYESSGVRCLDFEWMDSLKEWRCRTSADGDVCTPNLKRSLGPGRRGRLPLHYHQRWRNDRLMPVIPNYE